MANSEVIARRESGRATLEKATHYQAPWDDEPGIISTKLRDCPSCPTVTKIETQNGRVCTFARLHRDCDLPQNWRRHEGANT